MARAACSHLVTSYSVRSLDFNHLDSLILASSPSLVMADSLEDPLRQTRSKSRRPCSGASCSSRVPVPTSTASQGSGGFDQWGDLSAALHDQVVIPIDETVGREPSIFHPPPV
jgi:hypothetical protein